MMRSITIDDTEIKESINCNYINKNIYINDKFDINKQYSYMVDKSDR